MQSPLVARRRWARFLRARTSRPPCADHSPTQLRSEAKSADAPPQLQYVDVNYVLAVVLLI
eukprot:6579279-Pyramimonas_sp.AAC.1